MIARLSTVVVTEKDYEEMSKILTGIYYKGYAQSVEAHRQQLEKLGYRAQMRYDEQKTAEVAPKIFNQQNAADNQK